MLSARLDRSGSARRLERDTIGGAKMLEDGGAGARRLGPLRRHDGDQSLDEREVRRAIASNREEDSIGEV
jgi:hypothetical protein